MASRQRLCCRAFRLTAASSPSRLRPLRTSFASKSAIPLPQRSLFSTTSFRYAETIVKVPQMAESISEGTLSSFTKQVGDYVEQDEEIASIETDKIDVSVNAPEAGTIKELLASEGDTVTVGQDIAKLEPGEGGSGGEQEASSDTKEPASKEQSTTSDPEPKKEEQPKEEKKPKQKEQKDTPAPPKEDKAPPPKAEKKPPPPPPSEEKATSKKDEQKPEASPFGAGSRGENRVKMNRMRLRIAERLKQSQNTAAFLTTFNKVDMSSLQEFRKLYKDDVLKKTGVKLGFMGAFSKACVLAMKDIPAVNASIEGPGGGDTVVYRDYVDISVAVATPKGLVTPVVRNVESLDIMGIEAAIAELGKKARDNKLTVEDMAGGSFTISNGGVFGSLMGTPIINLPQTAVLGLHAINNEPVVIKKDGKEEIGIRPIMMLALTYDHRMLDGREAVQFLVKVKEYIEDPRRMLLA